MSSCSIQPLARLESLDRDLLHVFVVGPGKGEGIAIALPRAGWLLVDGATAQVGGASLAEIVTRWRSGEDDAAELLLLSHPHEDHVDGLPEVIEQLRPKRLAIAGVAGGPSYVGFLEGAPMPTDTSRRTRASKVRSAFRAMQNWEAATGRLVELVSRGAGSLTSDLAVSLEVLGPPGELLTAYLEKCQVTPQYLRPDANRYSLVLRLRFGDTVLLLPGDLPRTVGGVAVRPGWDELVEAYANLGDHAMAKIAHHGSAEAFHEGVFDNRAPRTWVVTPYNSSRLPRLTDADGLPRLVEQQEPVLLTAVPASRTVQASVADGSIKLSELVARLPGQNAGNPFKDSRSVEITPGSARGPLDCMWCASFDEAGSLRGLYRGVAALAVHRG